MINANSNQMYTVREVAKSLNVHVETVRRLLRDKRLKGFKFGRDWRISEKEINDFLANEKED